MRPQPPRFAPLTSPVGEHCDYPGFCVLRACARSLCKAEVKLGTRATPNLKFCRSNSLIPSKNSLFFEIFSLIIRLGNCARNRCSTAVSCIKLGSEGARIAKFPVKFPVSWESGWRRVRSALRRQPGSPAVRETTLIVEEMPANSGLLRIGYRSPGSVLATFTSKTPKVSGQMPEYSRFRETTAGDRFRSTLRGGWSVDV